MKEEIKEDMVFKIFIWIVLRVFSCFADISMFFLVIKKGNKWLAAILEIIWNLLVYIVLRMVRFRHPIIWAIFASSWSWVMGFILSDVSVEAGGENCVKERDNLNI